MRRQAYELGHLLFKIAYQDAYERGADGPVASDVLADVLESKAEALASNLGIKLDIPAIRDPDSTLRWKTRLSSYLDALHGDDVGSAFDLGTWIPLYMSVQGGYPININRPDQAQKAAQLAERLTTSVAGAGLDASTVIPLIEAARRVGTAGTDPSEVGRVGGEIAVRLAEMIEAQEADASGGIPEVGATGAFSATINTYNYLGDGPVINGNNAQVAYRNQSVTQTQTPEPSSKTTVVAESVATVLKLLPYSGLSADDQEDVQAAGSELLAEIDRPEQDQKKIKRAFMTLKGYLAPLALNVATGAANGAASGAEHAALTAIESMLNVQL